MAANDSDEEFFGQHFQDDSDEGSFDGFDGEEEMEVPRPAMSFHAILEDLPIPEDTELGWNCGNYNAEYELDPPPELPLTQLPFTGNPGLRLDIGPEPIDYFSHFAGEDFWVCSINTKL